MPTITVELTQVSPSTTRAVARGHEVLIDRPVAKEGADAGMMGGELLLAALGGCFLSNLLAAIRGRALDLRNVRATIVGELVDAPSRYSAIDVQVRADGRDLAELPKLVLISERACIVANTLRGGVSLTIRAIGSDQ